MIIVFSILCLKRVFFKSSHWVPEGRAERAFPKSSFSCVFHFSTNKKQPCHVDCDWSFADAQKIPTSFDLDFEMITMSQHNNVEQKMRIHFMTRLL